MTTDEFFNTLASLPINWRWQGNTIRSWEGGSSQSYTPLEIMCYYHGGTVSWRGGRLYKPSLLDMFFQQGEILGLPTQDIHAIFRASDNTSIDAPSSEQHAHDHTFRRRLIKACRLETWIAKREKSDRKKHTHIIKNKVRLKDLPLKL